MINMCFHWTITYKKLEPFSPGIFEPQKVKLQNSCFSVSYALPWNCLIPFMRRSSRFFRTLHEVVYRFIAWKLVHTNPYLTAVQLGYILQNDWSSLHVVSIEKSAGQTHRVHVLCAYFFGCFSACAIQIWLNFVTI